MARIVPNDWDNVTWQCYLVTWPKSPQWLSFLTAAIADFYFPEAWDSSTGDVDEATEVGDEIITRNLALGGLPTETECNMYIVGEVRWFAARGYDEDVWLPCRGGPLFTDCPLKDLLIAEGGVYGWQTVDVTPLLPEINDFVRSVSDLSGTDLGEQGGDDEVTLTEAQMPEHTHNVQNQSTGVATTIFGIAGGNGIDAYVLKSTDPAGAGDPHTNIPPYIRLIPRIYSGL